ncbi:glycosyl transferase family 41-domain-containing protein [Phascolomyces articulosus]|uniref:protein O-GlcNAc transferase n=1 Tax=Phascolomyces articulosus TaxID=60185 RepID=A0AAD5KHK2_9FUNG|nr:glycosyl transferase family 41-domain-containing protein [Phascolomyces articulosus]
MLFQQNYMPGAFPADRLYLQAHTTTSRQKQQEATITTRLRHDSDSFSRNGQLQQQQQLQPAIAIQYDPTSVVSSYIYPQQQQQVTQLQPLPQQSFQPATHEQQQQHLSSPQSAFSQYQQLYQHYYHEQSQQQQSHYLPSIMLPPQSPTLASYYFEGSNGWVNHYYDPKRRQYLSSRVDPEFQKQYQHQQQRHGTSSTAAQHQHLPHHHHQQQQHALHLQQQQQQSLHQHHHTSNNNNNNSNTMAAAAAAAAVLPTLDSLGLNPQQFQMAVQQQQQQQLLQLQKTSQQHMYPYTNNDLNQLLSPSAVTNQQHYLAAAAAAAAVAAGVARGSNVSTSSIVPLSSQQQQQQSGVMYPLANVQWTEEWRENMLQYAHTLYSTAPRNPELVTILHTIHNAYPDHLPTLLLLACVYYTYQDYQSSLQYNQLILKYDPHYVEAMSNIGTTLRSMGRTAEAEQWWYRAVKLRPGYWDAVENLVGVLCSTTTTNTSSTTNNNNSSTSDNKSLDLLDKGSAKIAVSSSLDTTMTTTTSSSLLGVSSSATPSSISAASMTQNNGSTNLNSMTNESGKHHQQQQQQQQQGFPRYKEALRVCEFVEHYFFKGQEAAHLNNGPIKAPKQLPTHQLPRMQNLFYAKGNLKYALGDIIGARREYEKGLELVFGGTDLVAVGNHIALACGSTAVMEATQYGKLLDSSALPLVLLQPDQAVRIIQIAFGQSGGVLPGLVGLTPGSTTATTTTTTTTSNGATNGAATGATDNNNNNNSNATNALQQANQTTSTILLTLAKLFQDMMNPSTPAIAAAATAEGAATPTMSLLLPLYYLSLALHPSPSTANNLGIILSNISGASAALAVKLPSTSTSNQQQQQATTTGTMLAMQYYMYGLQLDNRHPHLYTNLGSLLKDMGHLTEAVCMYEKAVECNPRFDVALANLGNAIKDMGRVQDSVQWYRRAVDVNPNFVDAVCGLVNSLGGVCDWRGRGGVGNEATVDQLGNYYPAAGDVNARSGWIGRVVDIVEKQLDDGAVWGVGVLKMQIDAQGKSLGEQLAELLVQSSGVHAMNNSDSSRLVELWTNRLAHFSEQSTNTNKKNEGGWVIRLIERIMRRLQRNWYLEHYGTTLRSDTPHNAIMVTPEASQRYQRPLIPSSLSAPPVPTVLPFHTFTYPLSAREVRLISHRNALRISHGTLTSSWVASHVYPPPPPPAPRLKIGYVSSDFNNHPLAHLMQSVFGFHDTTKYQVFCYATTPSDQSPYRQKIEREAETFIDVSNWSNQQVVDRIIQDGIHVLVNLNGYTKGARNEIFAARPCPVQCSFMGFAGTLGGGWCDWIIADPIVCPPEMVSCEVWRQRHQHFSLYQRQQEGGDFEGDIDPEENSDDFVYTEKFIYMPHSYFVNDHKQGFREEHEGANNKNNTATLMLQPPPPPPPHADDHEGLWAVEEDRRWTMRQEVFPNLPPDVVIFANFNQLYKLEPSTFRMWLRILERVPNAILWLLRFPPAGERHLRRCATEWAGAQTANRVIFTDVAPKHVHIHRGRVADIFLDTPECNAHTTAADILWSGTPIVTYPKYMHKMCSRVGASIAQATGYGKEMIVATEQEYEDRAVHLALGLKYTYETSNHTGKTQRRGHGDLMSLRKRLFLTREKSRLFDTCRWTRNLERGYSEAWRRWVTAEEFEDVQCNVTATKTTTTNNTAGCIWVSDPDD